MRKNNYFTGVKLDQVPVVLTPKEASLVLQIEEEEVIKLISKNVLKTIPALSALRIAAHSLFELLHDEVVSSEETTNSTGFVNTSASIKTDTKVGFVTLNQPKVRKND